MRHGKKINHLGRQTAHRKAMLANMACSLIEHKRINTTVAKAKALKVFVEPLVTKCKEDTTHNRRLVFSKLRSKEAVTELFREVAPKVGDRPGGYTRVIKLGSRQGDAAEMALVELVDFNETYNVGDKPKKKKSTRRAGKKTTDAVVTETPATEPKAQEEKPKEQEEKPKEQEEKPKTEAEAPKAENAKPEPKAEEKKDDKKDE
ncbi:50S ribosomal protein L17 [Gramella sp. AN32]|uniref:Large ribosomal subunit protein bL17 n=1 Tax=Christiangramia antarctica TaxID=2058158 RepID=A0ABW5X7D4_9FLAO|nr:50S ribosomal protein L17 [Gramella sp. AN32]MCM4157544.1 50S ribosomal protein L17 [Gramella sp. AN32]